MEESSSTLTEAQQQSVLQRVTYRLIPTCFLMALLCYLDRSNLSFAAIDMNRTLQFDEATYGLGAGLFFTGYFVFAVPSSILIRRMGPTHGLGVILTAWGLTSMAQSLISSPTALFILRPLLGMTESGFFPGVFYFLSCWYPDANMAFHFVLVMTATAISGVIGGPMAGGLMSLLDGQLNLDGWKWMFLLEGFPSVLLGIAVYLFMPSDPAKATFLKPNEIAWLQSRLEHERKQKTQTHGAAGIKGALKSRVVWHLSFIWFSWACAYYGIIFWLPLMTKNLASDSSAFVVGLLAAIPYLTAAISMILCAWHSDHTFERRKHLLISSLVGALGMGLAALLHSVIGSSEVALLLACMCIAASGVWSISGPFWGVPATVLSGEGAATGVGVIIAVGNLGGAAGPYIVGFVKNATGNYDIALAVLGGFMVLCGVLGFLLPNVKAETVDNKSEKVGLVASHHSDADVESFKDEPLWREESP